MQYLKVFSAKNSQFMQEDMEKWLASNRDIRIISMTSLAWSNSNSIYVVYRLENVPTHQEFMDYYNEFEKRYKQ